MWFWCLFPIYIGGWFLGSTRRDVSVCEYAPRNDKRSCFLHYAISQIRSCPSTHPEPAITERGRGYRLIWLTWFQALILVTLQGPWKVFFFLTIEIRETNSFCTQFINVMQENIKEKVMRHSIWWWFTSLWIYPNTWAIAKIVFESFAGGEGGWLTPMNPGIEIWFKLGQIWRRKEEMLSYELTLILSCVWILCLRKVLSWELKITGKEEVNLASIHLTFLRHKSIHPWSTQPGQRGSQTRKL